MSSFFQWLAKLFKKSERPEFEPHVDTDFGEYALGALENPFDPRDVQASAFQGTNFIPIKHITDISMLPRYDQKQNGSCVGHAIALAIAYYEYKELGKFTKPSPRFIYALAKQIDQLVSQGTYPRVGGSVAKNNGCATEETLPNASYLPHSEYIKFILTDIITRDAFPRKIGGYAFVGQDLDSIKNAIINNGVVCASLQVGNWNRLPVKPGDKGRHYILIYGYDGEKFYFANSWGKNWGDRKLGDGYFKWDDFKDNIRDIMVITDIPNKVMEEAKNKWQYKYFLPTERTGSYGTCADLKPDLLSFMDTLRGLAGIPFKPTSGLRTKALNDSVGGSPNSAHLRGLAMDIACNTEANLNKIKEAVRKMKEMGRLCFAEYAKSHVHIDVDSSIHTLGTSIESDDD